MAGQRMREQSPAVHATSDFSPASRGRSAFASPTSAPPSPAFSPTPGKGASQNPAWDFSRISVSSRHRDSAPSGHADASRGQPLDASTRAYFEPQLGRDLGAVRIHADARSGQSARSLQASAYTVGQEIHFADGKFHPQSREGRDLLGHELIHTLQQREAPKGGRAAFAREDHPLEQNAKAVAAQRGPIQDADQAMVLRQPEGQTPQPFAGSAFQSPELTLNGHTISGDQKIAAGLLESQLSVGSLMQPSYFGSPTTLQDVSAMLRQATPAMTDMQRWSLVVQAWLQKLSTTRQLPPISNDPIQIPRPSLSAASGAAASGSTSAPGPQQAVPQGGAAQKAAPTGLPDMPAAGRSVPGASGGPSTPGNWQPSVGSQWLITISPRGSGSPLGTSMQSQSTLGDSPQVVVQAARDTGSGANSVVAGGQVLTPNLLQSSIVQLQPFAQLLAGLAQIPGSYQASMTVQASVGVQVTLTFGPIAIQITGGVQLTAQSNQPTQTALAFSAMAGPAHPQAGTGTQSFGGNNWSLGVGPAPPFPGGSHGAPDRPAGGGMLYFGGNLPKFMQ